MPKMTPRDAAPVTITNVNGALIIAGGYLEVERPWMPSDITELEGDKFVPLHKLSKHLKDFLGKPLHFCKFFDDLMEMRNTICEEIMKAAIEKQDPLGQVRKTPSKRDRLAEVVLPEVVKLAVNPPVGMDNFDMHVAFASDFKSVVRVRVDAQSLEYVLNAVEQDDKYGVRGRKRSKEDRVRFDFKEIMWNYNRNCPYIIYKDADGAQHTKTVKLTSPAKSDNVVDEVAVAHTVNKLHDFFERCKRPRTSKHGAASVEGSSGGSAADTAPPDAGVA